MSAEHLPTTKRETLVARAAFVRASRECATEPPQWPWQAENLATARYPLPKVTRPREVRFSNGDGYDVAWHYRDGNFWSTDVRIGRATDPRGLWAIRDQLPACWLDALADLKANPTEEVEE
jgi:hypothetical protein